MGLEYARPSNYGPTFVSRANQNTRSVIDLVFVNTPNTLSANVRWVVEHQGWSDHIPLSANVPLKHAVPKVKGRTLAPFSDEEKEFIVNIVLDIGDWSGYHPSTAEEVERMTSAIAGAFSTVWNEHSTQYTIGPNSKEYWNDECTKALETAKREFFDKQIEEVATTNKRPWDLMEWIKERKNPLCEAIQFEGRPCHKLDDLWDALHSTYNAASDHPVDPSILDGLEDEPKRSWPKLLQFELGQALEVCSAHSAPGPNQITWWHLKQVPALPEYRDIIIALADGCIVSGHWPRHFKESTLVIIPKPNKLSYSTPKAFRPILLLNTLGKLIEKMILNRFQHDMIKDNLVDPNQMGGVCQRFTEDAGLFLTHLVHTGWAQKLQTSVVAFDVTQFFPLINHQFLLAVLAKLGFHHKVIAFFGLYLMDRFTSYAWN
ncbi:hypothetical protein H1R20_g13624, partial [Candolleomyces eurysporus]